MNPALTRTSYGDNMRKQRRVLNEQLRAEMIRTVGQDVERQECKALLRGELRGNQMLDGGAEGGLDLQSAGVLKAAETFEQETHRFSASLMLNLIYDHFAESMDDPVVHKIVVSSQRLFGAFVPVRCHRLHMRQPAF